MIDNRTVLLMKAVKKGLPSAMATVAVMSVNLFRNYNHIYLHS